MPKILTVDKAMNHRNVQELTSDLVGAIAGSCLLSVEFIESMLYEGKTVESPFAIYKMVWEN